MATKGASNRYGTTRGSQKAGPNEKIGFAWAKKFNKKTLSTHFNKHGKEMGCGTKASYEAHAVKFANTIDKKNIISYVQKNTGTTFKYNKKTNTLALISKDGYVITYYKPKGGLDYFLKQKNRGK